MSTVAVYSRMTEASPEVISDLIEVSEMAYSNVAERTGRPVEAIHRLSYCNDLVGWMGGTLCQERGYRAAWRETVVNGIAHFFLSFYPPDTETRMFGDPAWQQFLRDQTAGHDLPKMLLGTPEEVTEQALTHGLSEQQAQAWRVA